MTLLHRYGMNIQIINQLTVLYEAEMLSTYLCGTAYTVI